MAQSTSTSVDADANSLLSRIDSAASRDREDEAGHQPTTSGGEAETRVDTSAALAVALALEVAQLGRANVGRPALRVECDLVPRSVGGRASPRRTWRRRSRPDRRAAVPPRLRFPLRGVSAAVAGRHGGRIRCAAPRRCRGPNRITKQPSPNTTEEGGTATSFAGSSTARRALGVPNTRIVSRRRSGTADCSWARSTSLTSARVVPSASRRASVGSGRLGEDGEQRQVVATQHAHP